MSESLRKHDCSSEFQMNDCKVVQEITNHSAWYGHISGLEAEKLLRGRKTPYLYLLRKGELEDDYYVTFVDADLIVRHQPFVVNVKTEGWYLTNGAGRGPFTDVAFDDIVHLVMHCGKNACTPRVKNEIK